MATENIHDQLTFPAGADLSAYQYHAIALDDNTLADTGEEAAGILQNKPASGAHGTLGMTGIMKFAAGAGLSRGAKLTVTTDGWFTTGDSGYYIVGEVLNTVTSGSIGTGIFNFATAPYLPV